jgi:alpha-beta hydrolase superfamily lysophospholipase
MAASAAWGSLIGGIGGRGGEAGAASGALVGTFRASDGYRFYYRYYPASGERPRGRLVWLHGIRSHGGWYERSCRRWAEAGYETYFLDRRGAGWNTPWRGDAPSFRRLLDDVAEFVQHLRQDRPWLPLILGGISWGGKLALALPYRKPGLVQAVVLLCPGLKPRVQPPAMQRLRIALAAHLRPEKRFPIPLNEPELFTADPAAQRYIAADRYGLQQATARFLFQSFALDVYLRRARKHVQVPVYLALAGQDRIIDNAATRAFLAAVPGPLTVREYPQAHHTLEFEAADHPWWDDLAQWLAQQGDGPRGENWPAGASAAPDPAAPATTPAPK